MVLGTVFCTTINDATIIRYIEHMSPFVKDNVNRYRLPNYLLKETKSKHDELGLCELFIT